MTTQDTDMPDAQTFSALPKDRQAAMIAELLARHDLEAIKALGVKITTADEWEMADESPDVIEIKSST